MFNSVKKNRKPKTERERKKMVLKIVSVHVMVNQVSRRHAFVSCWSFLRKLTVMVIFDLCVRSR